MSSDATQFRRDFWTLYAELYPEDGIPSGWGRSHARITVESSDLHISLAVLGWGVGVWLRGKQGELPGKAAARLSPFQDDFRTTLAEAFWVAAGPESNENLLNETVFNKVNYSDY